jgi:diaminopimelate epimerase
MARALRCVPGEGLGNTFLLALEGDVVRSGLDAGELARRVCGQDTDGLLVLGAGRGGGPPRLRVLNRDGSVGGTCLNGLRVAAVHAGEPAGAFEMDGRVVAWARREGGLVELHLRAEDLPAALPAQALELASGHRGVPVPFWNPHCVVPVAELDGLDLEALARSAAAYSEVFPEGVNLEAIAERPDGGLRMRVWERGVGETRACGSGAVAVALLAWSDHPAPRPLVVEMPGGVLVLSPAPADRGGLLLPGPATVGEPVGIPL